ncbi:hypothetical protein CR513_57366, partial [Mucuna pruriens]
MSFFARESEIKKLFFSNQPMLDFQDFFLNEHHIDYIPRATLPNRPTYKSNPSETKKIQKQVNDLLSKGYVKESMSPYVIPVLLVPKKDGTWRMCVDCRAINKIIVKYKRLITRIDDMLDELHGSCYFSKIDLKSEYHQIRIREEDEWKTAFKIKYGLYEWLVMPFGITNAPMSSFLGKFVVYFDDILTYRKSLKEHLEQLRSVLHVLIKEKLYADNSKGMEVDEEKRMYALLSTLYVKLLGVKYVKEMYVINLDFAHIYVACEKVYIMSSIGNEFFMPKSSLRELLVKETHGGGLMGHFGIKRTLSTMHEHFY